MVFEDNDRKPYEFIWFLKLQHIFFLPYHRCPKVDLAEDSSVAPSLLLLRQAAAAAAPAPLLHWQRGRPPQLATRSRSEEIR